jgi:hypothetical protein
MARQPLARLAAHQFNRPGASRRAHRTLVQSLYQAAAVAVTEAMSTRTPMPMVDDTATLRR